MPKNKDESDYSIGKSLLILVLIVGVIAWAFAASSGDNPKSPSKSEQRVAEIEKQEAKLKEKQTLVAELAPRYCETHADVHVTSNSYLKDQGWPVHDVRQAWSLEECETIIGKLFDEGSTREELEQVINKNVWIGQTQNQLLYSWGQPNDVNEYNYGDGETSQYIYNRGGFRTQYVFLKDGKVTSYSEI